MAQRQTPATSAHEYLSGLVESLRVLVPAALQDWDPKAIHHARVSTRRLKAGLDLLPPALSPKRRKVFSRSLRRLRRRLGPLRDLDVMLGHLAQTRTKHTRGLEWLRQRLSEDRTALRQSIPRGAVGKILAALGAWWGLAPEVESADAEVARQVVEGVPPQLEIFARQSRAMSANEPTDIHALRIAGKRLRYTLTMAADMGHPLPRRTTRVFKQLQDALGLWHDCVVLADRILTLAVKHEIALTEGEVFADVLALARLFFTRAQGRLAAFGRIWRKQGEALVAEIAAALATGPQPDAGDRAAPTDPPTDSTSPSSSQSPPAPAETSASSPQVSEQ